MQQSNIEYLYHQLVKAVKRASATEEFNSTELASIKFIIEFDSEEKQEPKTNFDEIMYYRALPKKINRELDLDDVSNSLVTGQNDMPLWIKLIKVEDRNLYRLKISKRFRKKNIIKEWHKANDLMPVIIEKR